MNIRHSGVLHSFPIKNIFYDKMDLRFFYFDVMICLYSENVWFENFITFNQLILIHFVSIFVFWS